MTHLILLNNKPSHKAAPGSLDKTCKDYRHAGTLPFLQDTHVAAAERCDKALVVGEGGDLMAPV